MTNLHRFIRTLSWDIPKLIIPVILALAWFVSIKFETNHLLLILATIWAIGAVILFLRWPPVGLLLIVFVSNLLNTGVRVSRGTVLNPTTLLLILLIGLWLFDLLARQRKLQIIMSRSIISLLVFCLISLLAFIIGQLPWFQFGQQAPILAQLTGLAIFWLSAGAFILSAHQFRDLRWLHWMTWLILTLSGLIVVGTLIFGDRFGSIVPPPGGSLFWIWTVALGFSQAFYNRDLHIWQRVIIGSVVLATIYLSLTHFFYWRSGWLSSLVTIAAVLVIRYPRLTFPLLLGVSIIFRDLPAQLIAGDEYSFYTRLEAGRIILENIVSESPIFGLGPANYYYYTPLFPILGYAVVFNSHNNYIDILAQTGLLGLLVFLWFVIEVWLLGWRLRKVVPEGFSQAYVYGALGGLVGTLFTGMLGDWFLPFVYNIGLEGFRASVLGWLVLGGLVSIDSFYRMGARNNINPT